MNNHSGKSGFGDDSFSKIEKFPGENFEKGKNGEKNADSTAKLWNKIEKSIAKDKREEFKANVNQDQNSDKPKRRRRRRRHHGGGSGGAQNGDSVDVAGGNKLSQKIENRNLQHKPEGAKPEEFQQVNDQKSKIEKPEGVKPEQDKEKRFDDVATPVEEVPTFDMMEDNRPIEPFPPFEADPSSLPPQNYENRYKAPVSKEPLKKDVTKDKEKSEESDEDDPGEDTPLNPFEVVPEPKPLDQRSLDQKPLDEVRKIEETEQSFYEEEKTPEDSGESKEKVAPSLEGVVEPSENSSEKVSDNSRQIIELQAEIGRKEVVEEEGPDAEIFKEDFWTVLEHAGITRKKIIVFLIILVLLIGGFIGYLSGWYKNLDLWPFGGGSDTRTEIVTEKSKVIRESVESVIMQNDPYDVVSSFIFGLEFTDIAEPIQAVPIGQVATSAGFEAGFVFGEVDNLRKLRYVEYVQLLSRMENIYQVDLYNLLNLSVDRRVALNDYIRQFDGLIKEGDKAVEAIDLNLATLNDQYANAQNSADQAEKDFFAFIQANKGTAAYDTLAQFVDASQQAVELKARYSADNTLRGRFVADLNLLRPRYEDVISNVEALIKGVRVFDIPGSDINAIIPL